MDQLIAVSEEAGEAILEIYHQKAFDVAEKSDASPLTQADLKSNKIICRALEKLTPEIPVISEENEDLPYTIRATWRQCWMVDPLDGTKEFIQRNGDFTTNIGFIQEGRVVAGIVHLPVYNSTYWAVKGKGAFKKEKGIITQIKASKYTPGKKGVRVVSSRSHLNSETRTYIDTLPDPVVVPRGSSLKFLTIAEGGADLYPRFSPTMEWDTCAAQIILEEAGGSVVQYEDQKKVLRYNKPQLKNPYFIAMGRIN